MGFGRPALAVLLQARGTQTGSAADRRQNPFAVHALASPASVEFLPLQRIADTNAAVNAGRA